MDELLKRIEDTLCTGRPGKRNCNGADKENAIKTRIENFRRVLEQNEVLTVFDRYVFDKKRGQ